MTEDEWQEQIATFIREHDGCDSDAVMGASERTPWPIAGTLTPR